MVDSLRDNLNAQLDQQRRTMKNAEEIIENESLILEKKLEEEASYVRPETREKFEASFENPQELILTEEQQAKLDSLYE